MILLKKSKAGRVAAGALATVLTASGLGVVTAGPASAAPGDCRANAVCMAENRGLEGAGLYLIIDQGLPPGTCYGLPADFNDRISSLANTSQRDVVFFQDGGCGGAGFSLPRGSEFLDLGGFDNLASSIRV